MDRAATGRKGLLQIFAERVDCSRVLSDGGYLDRAALDALRTEAAKSSLGDQWPFGEGRVMDRIWPEAVIRKRMVDAHRSN